MEDTKDQGVFWVSDHAEKKNLFVSILAQLALKRTLLSLKIQVQFSHLFLFRVCVCVVGLWVVMIISPILS